MAHIFKEAFHYTGYFATGSILLWHQFKRNNTVYAKEHRVVEVSSVKESKLELRQVQVIFRHGARTPIHTLPKCSQVSYPPVFFMNPHTGTIFPFNRISADSGEPIGWSGYQAHLLKTPLKGGSYPGMLTSLGQDQMLMLGRRLAKAYRGRLNLETFDPDQVYVISTNIMRTVESARCVMAGFFGAPQLTDLAKSNPDIINIHVCPDGNNYLVPDNHACANLKRVNHTALKEADRITSHPFLEDRLRVEKLIDDKRLTTLDRIAGLDKMCQDMQAGANKSKSVIKQNPVSGPYVHHPRLSELLEQRDNAADQVPEFWSDAICRHPRMAALLTSEDMKALVYLTRVEVQEIPSNGSKCNLKKSGHRYIFHFEENPFFKNKVIIKEIYKYEKRKDNKLTHEPLKKSKTTLIDWKDGREFGVHDKDTKSKSKDKKAKSFFDWLSKDVSHTNKIAQALDDVYGSPMEFSKLEPAREEYKHKDINFVFARDDIVARETHGWASPSTVEPVKDMIAQHATTLLHMGMTGITDDERAAITRLSVGRLMQAFQDNADKFVNNKPESGKKLIFFSAHDSTLTAVMEALGIWDATWPPYGSDIRMELFQLPDTQDYFVKVVYNGMDMKLHDQQSALIPWTTYKRLMKKYNMTTADFNMMCETEKLAAEKKGMISPKSKEYEPKSFQVVKEEDEDEEEAPTGM